MTSLIRQACIALSSQRSYANFKRLLTHKLTHRHTHTHTHTDRQTDTREPRISHTGNISHGACWISMHTFRPNIREEIKKNIQIKIDENTFVCHCAYHTVGVCVCRGRGGAVKGLLVTRNHMRLAFDAKMLTMKSFFLTFLFFPFWFWIFFVFFFFCTTCKWIYFAMAPTEF